MNIAVESETGFIAGLAWDKLHNQILSASFAKLTSAGAANTIGHIYTTSPAGVTSLWLDLEMGNTYDAGSSEFQDGTGTTNSDDDVHNIGYIGFTDIEISADNSEVYVFNAYDRSVYIIPVNQATGAAEFMGISSVQIPELCSGTNANGYPYTASGGLGVYDGKVYASVTCTGPMVSDLEGAVYSFDPSAMSPTPVQELAIDYASWTMPGVYVGGISGFTGGTLLQNTLAPWSTGLSNVTPFLQQAFPPFSWIPGTGFSDFAPWAMDIEFDINTNGDIGMNIITKNRGIDATQDFNDPTNGGYMTKAALNSVAGTWTVESNGSAENFMTGLDPAMPANVNFNIYQRGQPDARFYHGEGYEGPSANGGAMTIPGFKEIMTSNTDNAIGNFDSGFSWHNVTNGLKTRDVNLLQGGNVGFAKGNSWGDLEAMCELAPIEIGNYVWIDDDKDGIQDPSESGQLGVDVQLWKDTDANGVGDLLLGTATTNSDGFYYFGGNEDANVSQTLAPFMTYELRISMSDANTANSKVIDFSPVGTTASNFDSDYRDTIIGNADWAYVTLSTTDEDLIFHEFDLGLIEERVCTASSNTPICLGDNLNLTVSGDPGTSWS